MKDSMLIVHGGAPTAVINASLSGAIREAVASGEVSAVYGARGGTAGILAGDFVELSALPEATIAALPGTPASFIGTSRYPLEESDYAAIVDMLVSRGIRYVLFTGGNGTMEACGKVAQVVARRPGLAGSIFVAGIPKTIDNDIAITDHAPGFGSAARYLAASVAELARDIASLPIHVCILESMGRNAGWLTAASAMASRAGSAAGWPPLGPHLIYVPEIPFEEERFLDEARTLYERFGGVLVVASEGLRGPDGKPIVPPIFQVGRSLYYGDVSAHLAQLVIRRLGIKARSEKPGVLGRCSIAHQSTVDRDEAILAGAEAVRAVLAGRTGVMVAFRRIPDSSYRCETFLVPLEEVMLHERKLPLSYINAQRTGIEASYLDWLEPLLGGPLPTFAGPLTRPVS